MWFAPGIFLLPISSVAYWWTRMRGPGKPSGDSRQFDDGDEYFFSQTKHELEIAVRVDSGFRFRVVRETGLHRFFKAMGLAREWKAPCARFRRDCYVISDDPEVRALLMDEALRDHFYALLYPEGGADGFVPKEIRVYPSFVALVCRKRAFRFNTDAEAEGEPARIVPRLRGIGATLAAREVHDPARDRDPKRWAMYALVAPAMPLLAIGLVLVLVDVYWASAPQLLDPWSLIEAIWFPLTLVMIGWIVATCHVLGGSSRLPPALAEIVLIGSFGLALAGFELSAEYNHEFDSGPVETVVSPVLEREYEAGGRRSPDRYYLSLRVPRGGPVERLRVSSSLYAGVSVDQSVAVDVREGALGHRWVGDIRPRAES